jgi:alanine dehydrogenase
MVKRLKLGILRETKTPPDRRTALTPMQCLEFKKKFPDIELFIQSSNIRAFKDNEYIEPGLNVVHSLEMCDILIGIKEVNIFDLIEGKTYMFFSHTAKEQKHNQKLLQSLLERNIKMIDYEYLTDNRGARLVAFGAWAGLVGAYNSLIAFGKKFGLYELKRAFECHDSVEMFEELNKIQLPAIKIVITGGGRVAQGAERILNHAGVIKISPEDFLNPLKVYDYPVYSQLDPQYYVERIDGETFDLQHFFKNPKMYNSIFKPFLKSADIYIACHFWDEYAPMFFKREDMLEKEFKTKIIADVSCDIGGPIPSTLRASEIANPFYGYNPENGEETAPFDKNSVTVMAIDNLPGEVPRDASDYFSRKLIENIFPSLFGEVKDEIIERATITENGKLGKYFEYLKAFSEKV